MSDDTEGPAMSPDEIEALGKDIAHWMMESGPAWTADLARHNTEQHPETPEAEARRG